MKYFPAALICLLCAPAWASEGAIQPTRSLFLTPDEATAIMASRAQSLAGKSEIRLGAIMYAGPHAWRLWLQDDIWTPETRDEFIRIVDVTPYSVTLAISHAEKAEPALVTLKPSQTYVLASGEIREAY